MSNRRPAPASRPVSAAHLRDRCERLESLLRAVLASRARARADLERTRDRLRTAGDDFVTAFEAIDARTDAAVAAGELRGLLGHDLDLDTLLTVTTEHLLSRFRPGNVAVWLCNGRGDHGLAAYGSCDIPRMRAESTLGLVGREVCPELPLEPVALVFERALDMVVAPPPGGGVLPGRRGMLASVSHRGERIGAVMVLQDESAPFQANAAETLGALAGVVGEHVDRITRIVMGRSSHWPNGASGAD
jgi:hypothetical protein